MSNVRTVTKAIVNCPFTGEELAVVILTKEPSLYDGIEFHVVHYEGTENDNVEWECPIDEIRRVHQVQEHSCEFPKICNGTCW